MEKNTPDEIKHHITFDMSDIGFDGVLRAKADAMIADNSYKFASRRSLNTDATIEQVAGDDWDVVGLTEGGWSTTLVLQAPKGLVLLDYNPNGKTATCYAKDYKAAREYAEQCVKRAPAPPEPDKNTLPVHFWMNSSRGPVSRRRSIQIERWEFIQQNYPQSTRTHLQQLFDVSEPESGGKLMLYYGQPGTGKTYTIRALAKHWAKWCEIHYVVDPEHLFGSASYLMHVLLDAGEYDTGSTNKWRLLVMEDTDEFLRADAKSRSGQSLSRLLNVADGILGQGLKVLVLITTNEPLNNLHKAISRQGRCLANIEFPSFNSQEANEWFARHEVNYRASKEMSLAEMYDIAADANTHIKGVKAEILPGQYL